MKKTFFYITLGLALMTAGACQKLDNYPGPNATLQGQIIDTLTGKNVQSEVSGDNGNGTRIKLLETSWSDNPTPLYLATKQNGTYSNTKVFSATYVMTAEGAFVPMVQTGTVNVDRSQTVVVKPGVNTVNFEVEPFLEVAWVGDPVLNADGTITARCKVTRGTHNPSFQQNVTDLWLFLSPTEYVGNNNYDSRYSVHIAYAGTTGNEMLGDTVMLTTIGGALPAKDYFLRIGSRIDYGLKQYNYSEALKLTVPAK